MQPQALYAIGFIKDSSFFCMEPESGSSSFGQHVRDNFTERTVTEIAKGVPYRCSNPECRQPTLGAYAVQDSTIIMGVAAHICAASPGGPRYNEAQENGLWLCQNCGRLADTYQPIYRRGAGPVEARRATSSPTLTLPILKKNS
ncbi:hypothetical protein ACFKHW_04070 [Bradyrhizobium lupini]|uniref:hypothetical protein n=1 Tax=Rhizobium lupini TaxID=136996 RepID=UPI00366DDBF6